MTKLERANFGSRLGVILATAGSAVGLGNVWRFPYMAGENGGAVFIIIYVACVLLLGIPCMISEFIIGRHGQCNTARAFHKLAEGNGWSFIGYMGVLTGFLITGYYAVVATTRPETIMGNSCFIQKMETETAPIVQKACILPILKPSHHPRLLLQQTFSFTLL